MVNCLIVKLFIYYFVMVYGYQTRRDKIKEKLSVYESDQFCDYEKLKVQFVIKHLISYTRKVYSLVKNYVSNFKKRILKWIQ